MLHPVSDGGHLGYWQTSWIFALANEKIVFYTLNYIGIEYNIVKVDPLFILL